MLDPCLIFSWLREKHAMPGAINILFSRRADYRVKLSVNNPAFLPSQFEHAHESSGMVIDSTPDEIRHTAREALTRMLEIEKCEKVVLNPLFGSSFPCKPKVLFYKTVIKERDLKPIYSSSQKGQIVWFPCIILFKNFRILTNTIYVYSSL